MSAAECGEVLNVFTITEFGDDQGTKRRRWTRVGVAFPHREGPGINIVLDALPVNRRLIVLSRKECEEEGGDNGE